MIRFAFWDDWPRSLVYVLWFFGFIFIASILLGFVYDAMGYSTILDWDVISQRSPAPNVFKTIQTGPFTLPLIVDGYYLTEIFQGSDIKINQIANYLFISATVLAFVLGITSSTYLERVWYLVISGVIIFILVYCKFDKLLIFGLSDNTPLVLIILTYLGLSYFFRAVQPYRDFINRLQVFLGLTFLWGLIIYFFAEVEAPFLLLAANGFLVPFLIGIFFMLMVSHEIMHFIIVAISQTRNKSGNSLSQFTFFSFIYLANVLIVYLYDTHVIDWNFYYLNPYILGGISGFLGLWGLQTRKIFYEKGVPDFPILVYVYLSMGIFCFASFFYFLGNMNDPILQVVKDTIIYSHLGFGFIFFIYVISNFMGMLKSNMKVTQVIYKPRNMPHFTFRFAGFIVVLAFALKENINVPVNHTLSGMFINNADYYKVIGDTINAETYYENGKLYGFMNHKANYSLGKLYESTGELKESRKDYQNATKVRPSEQAFVNWSVVEAKEKALLEALNALNIGQRAFPSGGAILNNKGRMFSRFNIVDSAMIYYDASYRGGHKAVPVTNIFDLYGSINYQVDPDSIAQHYNAWESESAMANFFLLRNQQGVKDFKDLHKDPLAFDSLLSLVSTSYLTNYVINQAEYLDSIQLNHIEEVAWLPNNLRYSESLLFALAIARYHTGYVYEAISSLRQLEMMRGNGKYFYTLGLLLMDVGDYHQAADFFELAMVSDYENAELLYNISKAEYDLEGTIPFWDALRDEGSSGLSDMASILLQVNKMNLNDAILLDDEKKSIYLHYNSANLDDSYIDQIFRSIKNPKIISGTALDLAKQYHDQEVYGLSERFLALVSEADKQSSTRFLFHSNMRKHDFNQGINPQVETYVANDNNWYLEALLALGKSDSLEAARYFEIVKGMNPFNTEAIIASADFFQGDSTGLKSYNILVEALLQNPNSQQLMKAYVKACIDANLISNALKGLESLQDNLDAESFNRFYRENENGIKRLME